MARVLIPASLRKYTDDTDVFEINELTLFQVLRELVNQQPELKLYVFDEQENICAYMGIYINNELVRNLETPTDIHDEILLVPAVAGG
jgi:adenylyltransferase/sulfurtransferase